MDRLKSTLCIFRKIGKNEKYRYFKKKTNKKNLLKNKNKEEQKERKEREGKRDRQRERQKERLKEIKRERQRESERQCVKEREQYVMECHRTLQLLGLGGLKRTVHLIIPNSYYPYTKVTGCLSVCLCVPKDLANR